jgi:response regulator RpfG family c-di-GMP phosphodiesterase
MKKILVVDDNEQNRYMIEILLKTNGYQVDLAANGIEALEKARTSTPTLIVSDILMPGMDGFSLCRAWMADETLRQIPFIFYTATYTDPRDEKLALELGADRFIVKPMDPDELMVVIREVLQQHHEGKTVGQKPNKEKDEVFLKEYNSALVRKLEDKMAQLQRSNRRLASLYKASLDLLTIKSVDELVALILKVIVESAGYQQANYFTYDKENNLLTLAGIEGYSDNSFDSLKEKLQFKFGSGRGVVGKVASKGQLLNLGNVKADPDWIEYDPAIHSALFVPIIYQQELLGVLALFAREENAFGEEDCKDITVLANSLAVAIINDRNERSVQRQLSRISALHFIDTAINSSLDMHNMLDIFLNQVILQMKVDAADVLLINKGQSGCRLVATRGFSDHERWNFPHQTEYNLAKQVLLEKQIVQENGIQDLRVDAEFARTWSREGFVTYFGAPLIASGEVLGALEVFSRKPLKPDAEWLDFFSTLAGQAAIAVDKGQIFEGLQRTNLELNMAYDATISGWSRAMDMRDQETEGHTQRVTEMSVRLAELMGLNGDAIVQIRRGALLHDIGKLCVPDSILFKQSELNPVETAIMRQHSQTAYDLLKPITYLGLAIDIPYCHHERWDGTGYPRGLKGEEIPLSARIFSVVDVYDALRSDRPYRKAMSESSVKDYIREQSGAQFDPRVVEKFFELIA